MDNDQGILNQSADRVRCEDITWSDTLLDDEFSSDDVFTRLKCTCGSIQFSVLQTDEYETSARCLQCGLYYIVHSG